MAAAEVRAVWQRTINRCFVQEDAKRAPKLACCQSSASSTKQVEGGPTSTANIAERFAVRFMPLNQNQFLYNLPPNTQWWLQQQPSYENQKYEQSNALESELENLEAGITSPASKTHDIDLPDGNKFVDGSKNDDSFFDVSCEFSSECIKNVSEFEKAFYDKNDLELLSVMDTRGNTKLTEVDTGGFSQSEKCSKSYFDPQSPWIGSEKNVPWWRTADRDDLASLVAQKSLNFIGNCDLPPPQKPNVRKYPCPSGHDDSQASTLDQKELGGCISFPSVSEGFPNTESEHEREKASFEGCFLSNSEKSFSGKYTKKSKVAAEVGQLSESDPSKTQLLEALCHSQTRAREAEKMAQQVCAEKEDLIKLFFRQASQLFAYKQWFQLLQLETRCYQLKSSDQPMSNMFPVTLPWVPQRGGKLQKNWQQTAKGKRGKKGWKRHHIDGYVVAFALGLGLVGAGLLLGWTVGWMFPFQSFS